MKVQYDSGLKLAGVGVSPWPRLGPDRWFKNYKLATYYGWDIKTTTAPPIFALADRNQALPRSNTQSLLNNEQFQRILTEDLKRYHVMTYNPIGIKIPAGLQESGVKFLGVRSVASMENKILFRKTFRDRIPFPKFTIYENASVIKAHELLKKCDPVVLQHETLSGGKGTIIARNSEQVNDALSFLSAIKSSKKGIVASEYIENSLERSLQCCVTRYGTIVGPMQKQLISKAELQDPSSQGNKFCGIEISSNDPALGLHNEMAGYCKIIGQELFQDGYRGIFGVDFLISNSGRPYVLEVNQRLTGATPILSMFYRPEEDVPFYLLHILELGNFEYRITDFEVNPKPFIGSMMILHSRIKKEASVTQNIRSGIYSPEGDFLSSDYRPPSDLGDGFLAQQYAPVGTTIKPGGKLAVIFSGRTVLDDDDELTPSAVNKIRAAYSGISLNGQKGFVA